MSYKLRDYQRWAEDSLFSYFENSAGNPVIAMPTGSGKAVMLASMCIQIIKKWPGQRILVLVPTKELVIQNEEKFYVMDKKLAVGVCSASLSRYELGLPVTIGTIGTIANRINDLGWIDMVWVDECHLVSHKEATQYRRLADKLLEKNPYCKFVGLSATPYRMGLGTIIDGGLFTDVCFDSTGLDAINWYIEQGYLIPLIPRPTAIKLDTTGVKLSGGDFVSSDLQRVTNKPEVTSAAVTEALSLLGTSQGALRRHHVLWFTTGIEHAEAVKKELIVHGENAVAIHSKSEERDEDLKAFLGGKVRHAVTVAVLTTGFDFPALDAIVMLRPTKSPGLWIQMLGRGTRPFYEDGYDLNTQEGRLEAITMSEKQSCLVLDFAYNTLTLGPFNDPKLPKKPGKGEGAQPVKGCGFIRDTVVQNIDPATSDPSKGGGSGGCGCWNHPSTRTCVQCGATFTFEVKFKEKAATTALLKESANAAYEKPIIEAHKVSRVSYELHKKEGRPDSIRIYYYCGVRRFSHYILPEHIGNPRRRSEDWWMRHGGGLLPESTLLARARLDNLKTPSRINVWINKEYPQIMEWFFND